MNDFKLEKERERGESESVVRGSLGGEAPRLARSSGKVQPHNIRQITTKANGGIKELGTMGVQLKTGVTLGECRVQMTTEDRNNKQCVHV